MHKALYYLFLFGVFIGFADASYLALTHFLEIPASCGPLRGCEIVTQSMYSMFLGIHLSYVGVIYYTGAAVLSQLLLGNHRYRWWVVRYSGLGALASIWFIYVQWGLIGAWCMYCLVSVAVAFFLFTISLLAWRKGSASM